MIGPPPAPRTMTVSQSPYVTDQFASGVNDGRRVVTLTTPRLAFLPSSVPCGPRVTSTVSMSMKSKLEVSAL